MSVSSDIKRKIFFPIGIFLFTFTTTWTFAEPLGLETGLRLFVTIIIISLVLSSYYYLITVSLEKNSEIQRLRGRLEELEKKQSYCCITQEFTPVCPLGVSSILPETENSIELSLNKAKKRFKWLGLSAFNVLHNNYDIFEKKKDVDFEFRILSPKNEFMKKEVNKYFGDVRGKIDSNGLIELSENLIKKIKSDLNSSVKVIHHNQMPTFRLILVDDDYAYVSFYERGIDALKSFQIELKEDENVKYPIKKWFDAFYEKSAITEEYIIHKDHKNRTVSSYNKIAEKYGKNHGKSSAMSNYFKDKIQSLGSEKNVLDVGCGTGRDSVFLSKKFQKVVAFDLSEKMLSYAKKKKNIEYICGDLLELNFGKQVFSVIWFNAVLHHLSPNEQKISLEKFSEWLIPGGVLLGSFRTDISNNYDNEYPSCPRYYYDIESENITKLLSDCGFVKIDIQEIDDILIPHKKWQFFSAELE